MKKNNKNLHRGDCSEKNDKRKRSIKTQRRPGAGSRSRVSSSSRWSRRLHDGGGGGMHTQTRARSNAHARNSDRLRPAVFYERTRMHTNLTHKHKDAHAHVRNHTHAANQKETGLSRDAIGGVRVSAASLLRGAPSRQYTHARASGSKQCRTVVAAAAGMRRASGPAGPLPRPL